MSSNIDHPEHYGGDSTYETIKVIDAWELGFSLGNAVKYISRAGKKDGATKEEDLRKAVWYLNHEIGEDTPKFVPYEGGEAPTPAYAEDESIPPFSILKALKGVKRIVEDYYGTSAYGQSDIAYRALHDILDVLRENGIKVDIDVEEPKKKRSSR